MQSSKKFFLLCLGLSVIIILLNVGYNKFQRSNSFKTSSAMRFQEPFNEPKMKNLSEDLTSCQLPVTDVELTYSSEVVLASKNITGSLDLEAQEAFVRFQSQFLFGYFNLNERTHGAKLFLSSRKIRFEDISVAKATYPQDLNIDNQWNEKPASPYQEQAFRNKFIKKGEPAQKIKYTAVVSAKACGSVSENTIEIILPKDPYLAYWAVSAAQFIPVSYLTFSSTLNPCVHPEMAEIKKSWWMWYTWTPSTEKCQAAIAGSSFYSVVQSKVSTAHAQIPISDQYFPDLQSYHVSLVFGMLYPNQVAQTVSFLKQKLNQENLFGLFKQIPYKDGKEALGETTVRALAIFLENLPTLLSYQKKEIIWLDDKSLQINVSGVLSSGKKIDLQIYYGITSLDYLESPSYVKFITDSLETSDFIFYTGHAGAGKNFNLSQWSKKSLIPVQDLQQKISHKKFQGFVLVSCYSNTYFGEDIIEARNQKDLKTVLVRSASQEYIFTTSLGLINFLRQPNLNDHALKAFIEQLDLGRKIFINFYG